MSEEQTLLGILIVLIGFNISHKTERRSWGLWFLGVAVGIIGLVVAS